MYIHINGVKYEAHENDTIIQVADRNDIRIPRFCYHKRLSIVASCRMCLVDVEGVKYPQPACSTIVSDGMKINTLNSATQEAQKNTMEFLLINHPLDCPICDQAGECELQDVSLEHGDYKSAYKELKRTVIDKNIGELVSTEMTRCIHCSRCVRFGEEVAGIKELGMTGRGENTKIETFINEGLSSQLSGNVIDLCPVGALNNSLYKYSARTWDLKQTSSVSSHDCLGSNIYYHTYKNEIKRCVPKENEEINLSWLSDNDRYGYEGISSTERIFYPMIRQNDNLEQTDFDTIANDFVSYLKEYSDNATAVMSAQSTCEEMYLFQKLLRDKDIHRIDHRSKECDFRYQDNYPIIPSFDCRLTDIYDFDNIVIVGANISKEFPIISVYIREAQKNKSTKVYSIATYEFEENFSIEKSEILNSVELEEFFGDRNHNLLSSIDKKKNNLVILGPSVTYLTNYSNILDKISEYSGAINAKLSLLGDQSNTAGAWAMGILPHRLPGGTPIENTKVEKDYNIIDKNDDLLVIYNLEPEYDFSDDNKIIERLKSSKKNVFFSTYITESIEKYADLVFPLASPMESKGSYISTNKTLQNFDNIITTKNDCMTGVDMLLALHKLCGYDTDFITIQREIKEILSKVHVKKNYVRTKKLKKTQKNNTLEKIIIRNPNSSNPTLRRCSSLLLTHSNDDFFSLPSSKSITKDDKIVLNENDVKLKLNIKTKSHNKPNNAVLVNISGTHKQKVGAYNTEVNF